MLYLSLKLKKLIIYSSIVNSGFLLFGFVSNNIDGIINSFLFLIIYICTTFLLFIIYLSIRVVHNNNSLVSFYDLLMLKKTHILIALIFCYWFVFYCWYSSISRVFWEIIFILVYFKRTIFCFIYYCYIFNRCYFLLLY